MTWLAVCGVVASVISVWFYLGLIVAMFFRESEGGEREEDGAAFGGLTRTALVVAILGTLVIGFLPQMIYNLM